MTTKARLHWFWRGVIAVAVGLVVQFVMLTPPINELLFNAWGYSAGFLMDYIDSQWASTISEAIIQEMPAFAVAVGVYGLLTRWFGLPAVDGELHRRKCDHILRGLSDPRCPECGEAI